MYLLENTNVHPSTAKIDIRDNDTAPRVWISEIRNGEEGGENGYFVLKRDNVQNELRIDFTIGGTATNGTDYNSVSNYVTFAKGEDTVLILISAIDDNLVELPERVTVQLNPRRDNNVEQYVLEHTSEYPTFGILTIADNDIAPGVWIEIVQNAKEGGDNGFFRLKRDSAARSLTINYSLSGTAKNSQDYTTDSVSQATFADGADFVDIPLNVIDDELVEYEPESVILKLNPSITSDAHQYILLNTPDKPATAALLLSDNDIAPNVWIDSSQDGREGVQNGFFRLRRDNVQNSLTVYYTVAGTAGTAGSDYTRLSGSVVFES
jgi:hypothetical protein